MRVSLDSVPIETTADVEPMSGDDSNFPDAARLAKCFLPLSVRPTSISLAMNIRETLNFRAAAASKIER